MRSSSGNEEWIPSHLSLLPGWFSGCVRFLSRFCQDLWDKPRQRDNKFYVPEHLQTKPRRLFVSFTEAKFGQLLTYLVQDLTKWDWKCHETKKAKKHGSELPRAELWFLLCTGVSMIHSPSFSYKLGAKESHSWLQEYSPLGKTRASLKTWF